MGFYENDLERMAYSPGEVAKLLGLGRTKIYELINNGSLETIKIGSRTLITRAAIEKFLANAAAAQ